MGRTSVVTGAAIVLAAVLVALGVLIGMRLPRADQATAASSVGSADRNEFSFQIDGYQSKNRGGEKNNLYFNYRYNDGLADADIPDFRKLRAEAQGYLDGLDPTKSVPLEIINKALCSKLKAAFPIQAISCQMQTLPVDPARPNETGSRQSAYSSIYTIGDIDPLNIEGPLFIAPQP